MEKWIADHRKSITALVGVAVAIAVGYWGTSNQWVELGILAATVLGVYQVPNRVEPSSDTGALKGQP